jgi:hypothetical protein
MKRDSLIDDDLIAAFMGLSERMANILKGVRVGAIVLVVVSVLEFLQSIYSFAMYFVRMFPDNISIVGIGSTGISTIYIIVFSFTLLLSLMAIVFLIQFISFLGNAIKESHQEDMEKTFWAFRNFLIAKAVSAIIWLLFSLLNQLLPIIF